MPSTHTADFQTAALKATDLEAVEKINVGLETELARKQLNIIADAPEIRIQDKTGSASETTMSIVADGGATHFRAGIDTFAEGTETKGNVKFQSSTGATTHAEIVGSSGTLELQDGGLALKLGSNVSVTGTSKVIQEITGPHARESAVLKKYPEVPLASNAQSGYTVTASNASDTRPVWQVFDGSNATLWGTNGGAYNSGNPGTVASSGSYPGEIITLADSTQHDRGHWMKIKFPHKVRLSSYHISAGSADRRPASISILGSNDDSNWYIVKDVHSVGSEDRYTIEISASTAYRYALLLVHSIVGSDNQMVIDTIEYHGYEDVGAGDDSVDTTVKSVYNAPDLTSAALYIDATKPDSNESVTDQSGSGVTVTAVGVTHDSTENAWELTGAATSNIVSGNLASLVGDHPHSVSAWVKADVLNGDGLFHVGTAEGEGDAASRVGFVDDSHISYGGADHFFSNAEWHNVTYTYNGEGSDKKLYLDGRLVNTAKNEDTFGEYPPFAMSDYSQYGYTVSASSSHSNYPSHYAFNDNNTHGTSVNIWITGNGKYNASGVGTPTGSAGTTVVDGTNQVGEWLQIEFPHQLKVSYMDIAPHGQNAGTLDRAPKDGIIAGSRDGSTWETMKSWTGVTDWALDGTSGVYKTFVIDTNTRKAYKYIRIIITKTGGTDAYGALSEVKIFGHRENDLVRFPDSVNTLKYPHVAMTGPAQRGYVVTNASNTHTGGTSIGYSNTDGYKVFNNDVSSYYFGLYDSGTTSPYVTTTGYWDTANYPDLKLSSSSGTPAGDWVSIEMPRKLTLQRVEIASADRILTYSIGESARDFEIWATNDNSSWTRIHQTIDATAPTARGEIRSFDVNASVAYKRFALIVTRNGSTYTGATGRPVIVLGLFNLYGTEPEDVVARVGDGYDGKIRNLRVFSTALSDARVQEIFDADKDEFGLAKSSVSVHKGRLGVGTTEPEGRFAVLDEAHAPEEFPPRAMTDYETYMEGHGVFRVYESSKYTSGYEGWRVFDGYTESNNTTDPTGRWTSWRSNSTIGSLTGRWVKLELPYRVNFNKIGILPPSYSGGSGQCPTGFSIIVSNDDKTWTTIKTLSSFTWKEFTYNYITFENDGYFKYIAIVATTIGVNLYTSFQELRYFGTREQGQSTLHDGQLTLTKNLTVPRIGPALDADDTPRRDRLVVEYNTSTNPTANGTVKDTSGRGLDGLFYGGASYDATEKALVFDGDVDYIQNLGLGQNLKGNQQLSASFWVKPASDKDNGFFQIGNYYGDSTNRAFAMRYDVGSSNYNIEISYADFENNGTTSAYRYNVPEFDDGGVGRWFHIVAINVAGTKTANGTTYDYGATTAIRLFLDGVELFTPSNTTYASAVSGTASDVLNLDPNPMLTIGSYPNYSEGQELTGSISNFKLYDVALTATEVKRLYDMGRLGNVIAQPVHIAAPLYAPGTIVQVESSTKYDTFSATGLNTHPLSPGNDVPGLSVTIHPKFANSKILISYDVNMGSYGRAYLRIQRTQGGNVTAIEAPIGPAGSTTEGKSTSSTVFGSTTNSEVRAASFTHYDDANSIVPITYQIQAWTYHSTYYVYINRAHQDHDGTTNNSLYWARTLSSITAKEVCQ